MGAISLLEVLQGNPNFQSWGIHIAQRMRNKDLQSELACTSD